MKYIISYDLGTGGTKASLFDEQGNSLASAFIGCKTYYPADGFHEQRPDDWWQSVIDSTHQLMRKIDIDVNEISALAVSGHSLGVVPIGMNGQLLSEYVPIWSDARAGEEAAAFFNHIDESSWYLDTGNGFPPPIYAIFKMMWYKKHNALLYKNTEKFIGTKDYVNYRMTGVLCTDRSYATGSGVYSLEKECYQESYILAAGIDQSKLPEVYPSTYILGTLQEEAAQVLGLPNTIQVVCGGVDNACMALGAGCTEEGEGYTSLGTSAWIAVTSQKPVVHVNKRPYVFAHCIPGQYVSATSIFSAGNSYRWVKNTLCKELVKREEETGEEAYELMNTLAKQAPIGAHKLFFNPSLAGGSGLDKSAHIRGGFIGLDLAHTQEDIIRATLEGICFNLRLALDVLEDYVTLSDEMLIVGGGGKSQFWRELFANIYNKTIVETNVGQDAGALGAAAVAAVGVGLWKSFDEVKKVHKQRKMIEPQAECVAQYEQLLPVFSYIADLQCSIGDVLNGLQK